MKNAPEKYRPSNGAEGDGFIGQWCEKCEHDSMEDPCDILTRTLAHRIDEPEYPVEWIRDKEGTSCTAFVPIGERLQTRCAHTGDMFEQDEG